MSTTETEVKVKFCPGCETELFDGVCYNVECPEAAAVATEAADRKTAKATTTASTASLPRAFRSNGSVD